MYGADCWQNEPKVIKTLDPPSDSFFDGFGINFRNEAILKNCQYYSNAINGLKVLNKFKPVARKYKCVLK